MQTSHSASLRSPPSNLAPLFLPDSTTSTQIRAILRSHSPPPDNLASTISALSDELARYDDQISFSEDEIERLSAYIARVRADRAVLKAHHDDLCGLRSPIRHLPSEVLVHVFTFCATAERSTNTLFDQYARLAKEPLLMVSRVCIRWHKIALGTPSLWDTIELHSDDLWITTKRIKKAMRLLNLALDRGKHTPLNLGISIVPGMDFARPLELVSQHCERWKNVTFFCRSSDLRRLRGIKGKLPLLETFEIELQDGPSLLDFLQVAPRLRNFGVGGRFLPNIADAYFGQLQELACLGQDPRLVPMAVSFMSRIPHTIKFRLQLFISNWDHDNILGIDLPPTSSNLISLSMDTRDYFAAAHCVKALSDIFSSLTLPQLRNLDFRAENSPFCVISWPHSAFLSLAARSSFHTHLETLFLDDVVITEAELVETLKALPLLQRLAISDHQLNRTYHRHDIRGANQLLITDSLLVSLTLKPNSPRLLPHLHSLSCQSLLKFDDHVYLDFLLSRLAESRVFKCRMYWLPGHHRELDPIVVARLRELCIQKGLLHEFAGARAYGP